VVIKYLPSAPGWEETDIILWAMASEFAMTVSSSDFVA
jgi:hypothetical protein